MLEFPELKFELYYDKQKFDVAHAPVGWNECEFSTKLDVFFGTTRKTFDSEIRFVYESANILRQIMYLAGPTAEVLCKISKLNKFDYEQKVLLKLDLQKYNDTSDGVSCGFTEISVMANIDALMDVEYSIPVSDAPVPVNIGGIGVAQFAQFIGGPQFTVIGGLNAFSPSLSVVEETVDDDITLIQSDYDTWSGFLGGDIGDSWFFNAQANFSGRVSGKIDAFGAGWVLGQKFYFYIREQETDTNYLIKGPINISSTGPNPGRIVFDFDIVVPFVAGNRYTIIIHSDRANLPTAYALGFNSIELRVDYRTFTQDYQAIGMRAKDLFRALMQRMNPDKALMITTTLLDTGQWERLVMLSGDCIRGVNGATIQTSFRDFMQSMSAELFAGFKVYQDESIKLERLNKFYNKFVNAGNIGEAKNCKYEVINEAYFSKITAGYDDNEYQNVDGKDEFNTEENWSVEGSTIKNNIEVKSKYRADPRGIDQLLIDFRAQLTKDKSSDKQVFMVEIQDTLNGEGFYNLVGVEQYKKVEGVSSLGRTYNINLSPRAMLIRQSALLNVQFAINKQGKIKFQTSKKNAGLKITRFDNSVTSEKDPLTANKMNAPLYLPIKCTATFALNDIQYKNIIENAENTGGFITFSDRGKERYGFCVGSKENLTGDNIKEFTFYLTTDNDLTTFYK